MAVVQADFGKCSASMHMYRARFFHDLADDVVRKQIGYDKGKHGEPVVAVCWEGGFWECRHNQGALRPAHEKQGEELAKACAVELARWKGTRGVTEEQYG